MQLPSPCPPGWEEEPQGEPELEQLHFGSFLLKRGESPIAPSPSSAKSDPVGSCTAGSSPSQWAAGRPRPTVGLSPRSP